MSKKVQAKNSMVPRRVKSARSRNCVRTEVRPAQMKPKRKKQKTYWW